VARAVGVSKNIVKVVNHTLFATNLVKEGNPNELLDLNDLHNSGRKEWKLKGKESQN